MDIILTTISRTIKLITAKKQLCLKRCYAVFYFYGIQTYTLIIMKDMKHTILIVTGRDSERRMAELLVMHLKLKR
jgi:hypothetical protein